MNPKGPHNNSMQRTALRSAADAGRSAKEMKSLTPKHTNIKEAIDVNGGILVREDYFGYPKGESNIYLLIEGNKIEWFAELPMENDAYVNPIVLGKESFKCGSWNGFTCTVSLIDGKIINRLFTK